MELGALELWGTLAHWQQGNQQRVLCGGTLGVFEPLAPTLGSLALLDAPQSPRRY
jgi:hypothetical protein